MAGELEIVRLKDDFYRDGFRKVLFALGMVLIAIGFLVATSLYLFFSKPPPVYFSTDNEWRILHPVPLDQPYLSVSDLIQWVSAALSSAFTYDYTNYDREYQNNKQFFTENGWKVYNDLINKYANPKMIASTRTFVNASPYGAPFILKQGILNNTYGWWIQSPLQIKLSGYQRNFTSDVVFQILVIRIPTLNNIDGVAIDNIVVPELKTPVTTTLGGEND